MSEIEESNPGINGDSFDLKMDVAWFLAGRTMGKDRSGLRVKNPKKHVPWTIIFHWLSFGLWKSPVYYTYDIEYLDPKNWKEKT